MSAADDESWGGEGEGVETGDTSSQVATKRKRGSELDDIMSEVAGRAAEPVVAPRAIPASSEPIVVPRGAGIAPMSPGPIKADPIPGMDGKRHFFLPVLQAMWYLHFPPRVFLWTPA